MVLLTTLGVLMSITLRRFPSGGSGAGVLEETGGVGVSLVSGRNSSITIYLVFD